MLDKLENLLPSKWRIGIFLLLIGASLVSSITTASIQAFSINERLQVLEQEGSVTAKISAKDIDWICKELEDIGDSVSYNTAALKQMHADVIRVKTILED